LKVFHNSCRPFPFLLLPFLLLDNFHCPISEFWFLLLLYQVCYGVFLWLFSGQLLYYLYLGFLLFYCSDFPSKCVIICFPNFSQLLICIFLELYEVILYHILLVPVNWTTWEVSL
jgi:hypothetical protein